jgi:phospholipid/cholesterol/gamma-HCH transport system substrate-binding protein
MSQYRKNILVGATVLLALVLLALMVLRFSDAPFRLVARPQMNIVFVSPTAEGLSEGSPVFYKGVSVGRVAAIRTSEDQRNVIIDAMVDRDPPLPANLEGIIRSQLFGGGSSISLGLIHPRGTPPEETMLPPQPTGRLTPQTQIPARFVGVDLLPAEFVTLAVDLTQTSRELRQIGRDFRESQLIANLSLAVDSLRKNIEKAGLLADSLREITGSEELRNDLRLALENFRKASESAVRIGQQLEELGRCADARLDELGNRGERLLASAQSAVDDLGARLGDRLTQVARVLENFEQAARKLHAGDGSAARLLNDPRLYETLLDTSRELELAIRDLRRLVQQWEQEGVPLKLR